MLLPEIEYFNIFYLFHFVNNSWKKLKGFQNIVAISKLILLVLGIFFFFVCRASRIWSRGSLILCAVIVVFSTRIFQNLDLGRGWLLKCWTIELESLRSIIRRRENKIFNTIDKANIYLRYIDVIFFLDNSTNEINIIQKTFQNNSVLNFTQELNVPSVINELL